MAEAGLAAVCGTYCGVCRYNKLHCEGCGTVKGKPFWVKDYYREVCRLYDCAVNQKRLVHCGECAELPCALFLDSSDPSFTPEQAEANRNTRIRELRIRKDVGNEAWLNQQEKGSI